MSERVFYKLDSPIYCLDRAQALTPLQMQEFAEKFSRLCDAFQLYTTGQLVETTEDDYEQEQAD